MSCCVRVRLIQCGGGSGAPLNPHISPSPGCLKGGPPAAAAAPRRDPKAHSWRGVSTCSCQMRVPRWNHSHKQQQHAWLCTSRAEGVPVCHSWSASPLRPRTAAQGQACRASASPCPCLCCCTRHGRQGRAWLQLCVPWCGSGMCGAHGGHCGGRAALRWTCGSCSRLCWQPHARQLK